MISGHGLFSFSESQQGVANRQDCGGVFQGYLGLGTGGCLLARRPRELKASVAMDLI